jgi:hypothetical protein
MEELLIKGLLIDGCAGTSAIDSQQERLNIEGCDITPLKSFGRINDNHSKTFAGSIGRIIDAKKILKKEDCSNERQKMYWEKVKKPYIYVRGELYNDEDHPNAKAAAAIMSHLNTNKAPLSVRMSVEGSVIARKEGGVLDRTKVHSVALTFTPANKETLALPIDDLKKSEAVINWEPLIKSVDIIDNPPSFIESGSDDKLINLALKITNIINVITDLKKALTAGYPSSSDPSSLVGGGVLQVPNLAKMSVTCDNCGKKQIVSKNQVKCGHCGSQFSMQKISQYII